MISRKEEMEAQSTAQPSLRNPYRSTSEDVSPVASSPAWPSAWSLIDAHDIGRSAKIVFAPDSASGGSLRRAIAAVRCATKWAARGLRLWRQRMRDRQQILSFDDHLLRDVGLTRHDIQRF
jgi:uncharacterized protein YjiS (DUF1127 family)